MIFSYCYKCKYSVQFFHGRCSKCGYVRDMKAQKAMAEKRKADEARHISAIIKERVYRKAA